MSSPVYCRSGRLRLLLLPGAMVGGAGQRATSWQRVAGCKVHVRVLELCVGRRLLHAMQLRGAVDVSRDTE